MRLHAHDPAQRQRLLGGRMSPPEVAESVRHAFAGCTTCSATIRDAVEIRAKHGDGTAATIDASVVGRAIAAARRAAEQGHVDRAGVRRLAESFAALPPGERRRALDQEPTAVRVELCAQLTAASIELRYRDVARSRALAELAVETATATVGDEGGAIAWDTGARAWIQLANACRLAADFPHAEEALIEARRWQEKGSGDPLLTARGHAIEAALRSDAGQFAAAVRSARRALRIHERVSEPHVVAGYRIDLGAYLGLAGEHDAAIRALRRGLELLDAERDPRMALGARHNLALVLQEAGELEAAAALLAEIRPQYEALGDRVLSADATWLAGKIAATRGRLDEAERLLGEARDQQLAAESTLDAALTSLELAAVYLRQGRAAEVKALALPLVATFGALQVPPEMLASILLFGEAAARERATLTLVAEAVAAVEALRRRGLAR